MCRAWRNSIRGDTELWDELDLGWAELSVVVGAAGLARGQLRSLALESAPMFDRKHLAGSEDVYFVLNRAFVTELAKVLKATTLS